MEGEPTAHAVAMNTCLHRRVRLRLGVQIGHEKVRVPIDVIDREQLPKCEDLRTHVEIIQIDGTLNDRRAAPSVERVGTSTT